MGYGTAIKASACMPEQQEATAGMKNDIGDLSDSLGRDSRRIEGMYSVGCEEVLWRIIMGSGCITEVLSGR